MKSIDQTFWAGEESFRAMFDQAAIGVAQSDLKGGRRFVNDRLVEMLGYTREELFQLRFEDITHPDDLEADLSQYDRLLRGEIGSYTIEERFIRKDGSLIWVESTASLVRDRAGNPRRFMAMLVDMTARKEAEANLRAADRRYRQLLEELPAAIYIEPFGETQPTAYISPGIEAMLGYSRDEWTAGPEFWPRVMHPDDLDRVFAEHRRHTDVGDRYSIEYRVLARDGRIVWVRDQVMVVRDLVTGEVAQHGVLIDVTDLKHAEEELSHQALHDPLTGLANRTLFQDRLRQALSAAKRSGSCLAVLLLDQDRFKEINDTYGHQVGDDVIREVSTRLRATLRASDTLARLGGDEYAILLPDADLLGATYTAAKLSYALEPPIDLGSQRFHVGASIGIALYPDHTDDPDALLRHADVAMYTAKAGNSGYAIYQIEADSNSPTRLALSVDLREAIASDALVLHYQPQMRLASGSIDGLEALVRWNHPELGMIPPDQFIPLAEHSGLIRPLTAWVIDKALRQCGAWRSTGSEVGIAVNLSARSLHDPDLITLITQSVHASGVPPAQFTVEITESMIMANPERAMETLTRLTEIGVRLSIDDFGTGYSSLAYLQRLRAHVVKIDKSFVIDLHTNIENGFIVRSVIELGHNLGLEVVAEGVENQAVLETLSFLKCDFAQGFYLSRPMNATDMTVWLRKHGGR
jgi:diguanylate cyclase (GGDEF)-like protein/PAS domain S-box-containing protein